MPSKSFISDIEDEVLTALNLAYIQYNRPVTLREIISVAFNEGIHTKYKVRWIPERELSNFYPEDEAEQLGSGATQRVFTFPDRVLRYLKRLEKRGLAKVFKEGQVWKALPLEGTSYKI